MQMQWTSKALSVLVRLHEFLATVNKPAATRVVKSLTRAASDLLAHPHLGERMSEFDPRDVRRILIGQYEMRYEIENAALHILRVWHTREKR